MAMRNPRSILSPDPAVSVDVLFISMPFGLLCVPSMGIGLLKATLAPPGISSRSLYFTFAFAQRIGASAYLEIARGCPDDLVGEWIFSGALYEDAEHDVEGYVREVLQGGALKRRSKRRASKDQVEHLLEVRGQTSAFLEECCDEVLAVRPRLVCFTSLFQQHVASLALARRLKRTAEAPFILFGGANCEGPMGAELIRQFPFVDAVVSGEADLIFPELAQRILAGAPVEDIPGVYTSLNVGDRGAPCPNAPSVRNMDALPFPDYDDYFEQAKPFFLNHPDYQPRLLFETSRGCWWGEKHHCTFCGLNGMTMAFRSKSAERALEELLYLTSKHPGHIVSLVDNILDMKYFKDFIPRLAQQNIDLHLFYEVKANLKKEQIRLLREAGIVTIQPGIESLSTEILRMMRKGVTALQNVQLLKWCKELGVDVRWNVLWGFPEEATDEYAHMAERVPWLFHLRPPIGFGPIRLDRFSPYFEQAASFGFTEVEPSPAYGYVYPLAPAALANLAYYFTDASSTTRRGTAYTRPLEAQLTRWRSAHAASDLFAVEKGDQLLIFDTRPAAHEVLLKISGVERALYQECDAIRSAAQLQRFVNNRFGTEITVEEIEQRLQPLLDRGLMIQEGTKYLSLAIPVGTYIPDKTVLASFFSILEHTRTAQTEETAVEVS